jgi:hypothetical protein
MKPGHHYRKNLMKRTHYLIKALLFILISVPVFSQKDLIRQQSCSNLLIDKQVDSLKKKYTKDGYLLVREASMAMESEFEMPVIMPLTEGSWYHFVFIGEYTSKLYEVRMYDWQERMVIFRQKKWGDIDGNIIEYSYVPKVSEFHMMKPVQVNKQKKRNLCGYVMMFKRTANAEASSNALSAPHP